MKRKPRKQIVIVLAAAAVVIAGVLTVGYFTINKMFSVLTDSFYQSALPNGTAETEQDHADTETNDDKGGENGQNTENGTAAGEDAPPDVQIKLPPEGLDLSAKEFKELEKKVAFGDKLAVLHVLSTGLSNAEYLELVSMLSGGITGEEVQKAYTILSRSLSEENKEKILTYYNKYADLITQ